MHSQTWVLLRKTTTITTATITSEQSQRLKMIRTCSVSMNSNAIVIRLYFCEFHFGYSSFFSLLRMPMLPSPQSPFESILFSFFTLYKCLHEIQIHSSKMKTGQHWQLETGKRVLLIFFSFWCICRFGIRSICSCRASRSISFDLKYVSSFHANVFYKLH